MTKSSIVYSGSPEPDLTGNCVHEMYKKCAFHHHIYIKVALNNSFILTIERNITYNVKGVTRTHREFSPDSAVSLSSTKYFSVFAPIVLV